jgi:hypothetical protein
MAKGRWPTLHTYGMILREAGETPEGEPVRVSVGFNDYGLFLMDQATEQFMETTPIGQALAQAEKVKPRNRENLTSILALLPGLNDADMMTLYNIVEASCQERGMMG